MFSQSLLVSSCVSVCVCDVQFWTPCGSVCFLSATSWSLPDVCYLMRPLCEGGARADLGSGEAELHEVM